MTRFLGKQLFTPYFHFGSAQNRFWMTQVSVVSSLAPATIFVLDISWKFLAVLTFLYKHLVRSKLFIGISQLISLDLIFFGQTLMVGK